MVDDELVYGESTDVETKVYDKEGLIEVLAETSKRFSCEEDKDENR